MTAPDRLPEECQPPERVVLVRPATGGIAHVAASCVGRLAAEGTDVTEIVVAGSGAPAWLALAAVRRHRLAIRSASVIHLELGVTALGVFWFGLWARLWLPGSGTRTVAVIHDAPQTVRNPGIGLIRTAPGWRDAVAHHILARLLDNILLRTFRRGIDRYVVLSDLAAQAAAAAGLVPVDAIVHGADPAISGPDPGAGSYVLFAGFIGPGKGVDVLCRSWPLVAVPGVPLLIVGGFDRQHQEWQANLAAATMGVAGDSGIEWLGSVDDERFQRHIADAAVVVLPYTAANPASGILVRAMIQGRPIVASAIPTFEQHLIDDRTGLLVAPGNPDELATAIRKLLQDRHYAGELGRAAAAYARANFSWESHVAGLRRSYRLLSTPSLLQTQTQVRAA